MRTIRRAALALAVLGAAACPASTLAAAWTAPAVVPGAAATGPAPAVVLTPTGAGTAVIVRRGARSSLVEVARSSGAAARWRAVAAPGAGRLLTPEVATDADGGAVAAWVDGGVAWAAVRATATARFGAARRIAAQAARPGLAMARDGTAALAYLSGNRVFVALRGPGGAFGAPVELAQGANPYQPPGVAALAGGRVVVTWTDARQTAVRSAIVTSGAVEPLPDVPAREPFALVAGSDGEASAVLAFADEGDEDQGVAPAVRVTRLSGAAWSPPVLLAEVQPEATSSVWSAKVVVGAGGEAFVLILSEEDSPGHPVGVQVARLPAGASAPRSFGSGFVYESTPALALAGAGAVAGWYEEGEPGITTSRDRDATALAVPASGRAAPAVRLGGNHRTELTGLAGTYAGPVAAVLRGPADPRGRGRAVVRVSVMR